MESVFLIFTATLNGFKNQEIKLIEYLNLGHLYTMHTFYSQIISLMFLVDYAAWKVNAPFSTSS